VLTTVGGNKVMDKVKLLLIVVCLSLVSTGAFATGSKPGKGKDVYICYKVKGVKGKKCVHKPKKPKYVAKVPEIDGAGAALGVALLGGIVMIVRERRRPQARPSQPAMQYA